MQYQGTNVYVTPTQAVPTYYNPNIPIDSRTISVPQQQTPGALVPKPPQKPPQTEYERSVGLRIRYAMIAGVLFVLLSLPITYRLSSQIWGLFSSNSLIGKAVMIPTTVQHPNGYQVQQMVEKPGTIKFRAIMVHAVLVVIVMYIVMTGKN